MSTVAHTTDPETSHAAAARLDPRQRAALKLALITLLDWSPKTGDELIRAYADFADDMGWPRIRDPHSVKRRLSELHTHHHVVRDSGSRRLSAMGREAVVWELSCPVAEARAAVKGGA